MNTGTIKLTSKYADTYFGALILHIAIFAYFNIMTQ